MPIKDKPHLACKSPSVQPLPTHKLYQSRSNGRFSYLYATLSPLSSFISFLWEMEGKKRRQKHRPLVKTETERHHREKDGTRTAGQKMARAGHGQWADVTGGAVGERPVRATRNGPIRGASPSASPPAWRRPPGSESKAKRKIKNKKNATKKARPGPVHVLSPLFV